MTFEQLFMKSLDGKLSPLEKEEMRLHVRTLSDVSSLVKTWQSPENGVKQGAISFPFFPLIKSESFVVDKSEFIVEIPETYNHLFIMGMAKTTNASSTSLKVQANDDTGANYSLQRLSSAEAVVSSAGGAAETNLHVGPLVASGADAGESGFFALFFPHYKSSFYKSCVSIEGTFRLSPTVSSNALFASQWRNTATLKKLRFFSVAGNIKAGSLISIYGID